MYPQAVNSFTIEISDKEVLKLPLRSPLNEHTSIILQLLSCYQTHSREEPPVKSVLLLARFVLINSELVNCFTPVKEADRRETEQNKVNTGI